MGKHVKPNDETQRRKLQEYIFSLEQIQEEAERLFIEHERLKHSQDLLMNTVPLGSVSVDREGTILQVNRRILEILGSPSEEATRAINVLTFPPLVEAGISDTFRHCMDSGRVVSTEVHYTSKWGKDAYLGIFVLPRWDSEGNVCGCQALVEDISEHKRAEEALRESEERYRLLTQNSLTGIYIRQDGLLAFVNDQLAHLLGYSPQEMIGVEFWSFIHPDDSEKVKEWDLARSSGREVSPEYECRVVCKDHSTKWVHLLATSTSYRGRLANMGNVADITARKSTEEALRESQEKYRDLYEESKRSEELYRSLLDSSPGAVVVYDQEGRTQYLNDSFTRIFGWRLEEVQGRRLPFVPDSQREVTMAMVESVIHDGLPCYGFETKRYTKEGDVVDVIVSASRYHDHLGNPLGMLVVLTDVTERKRLEEQLRQAAKMEAIGRLAGGVAHDFNNLLTAIIGYANILLQTMDESDPKREKVQQIDRAAEHAANLTKQLLAYSRKQVLDVKVLDLNLLVTNFETMLRRLVGEQLEFITDLDPSLGMVSADATQIEQILMNLAVNARDAMPKGGKLTIRTRNVVLEEPYTWSQEDIEPGPYIMFSVSDTGKGMDAATRSRIFDPFFTTKEKSPSTGLGLSTVYGVAKQHGGHVTVTSEPGRGATFEVYLPRVDNVSVDVEKSPPPASQPRGKETILVVEDEDLVRSLAREALEMLGYTTLTAADPAEALTICDQHQGNIDVLLTDVILPGMDGKRLFEEVSTKKPRTKVLYMSGYTEDAIVHHGVLAPHVCFLRKPFSLEDMATKLREVLDEVQG